MLKHYWVVSIAMVFVIGLGLMGFTGVCSAQRDNTSANGLYKNLLYSVDVPLEQWSKHLYQEN